EANSTVTLYDGKTELGTATANGSGAWSYTTGALANGAQVLTATATDAAGNTSAASNAVNPSIGEVTELTGVQAGSLSIANSMMVDITGTIYNSGTIGLNASGNGAELAIVGPATLTGSGKVTLSNNAGNTIGSNGAAATLTNANNTISGAGTIGDSDLALINQGTIDANDRTALVLNTGSNTITNAGMLEATSSGGLDIDSNVDNSKIIEALGTNAKVVLESTITNTTTGMVLASGSGAQVDLDNATISGGTLQTSSRNALIETVAGTSDELDGGDISSGSTVEINGNSTLTLEGTVNNFGTLLVNGGILAVDGTLAGGTTEISGAGKMVIAQASGESVAFQTRSTGQLVLDQATNYTGEISGFGTTQSIDLADIDFAAGVTMSYQSDSRRNAGGVLTITQGTQTVHLDLEGSYTLANFRVASDGDGGTLLTDPTVVNQRRGNASETIGNNTVLEVDTPDRGNITFSKTTGTLSLDQPATFTGKVSGFNSQNTIDLPGIAFGAQTTLGYSPNSNNIGGTLSVTNGTQGANIALLGSYMASSFVMAGDSHGGTMILADATPSASQTLLTNPHHA
ncbi:MAG TPA: Ig-like domain-containing protein, partial [Rhizomicrobium sp.]|nr:Ig-like domain-containing protein [Rhizomicrobium sp.]